LAVGIEGLVNALTSPERCTQFPLQHLARSCLGQLFDELTGRGTSKPARCWRAEPGCTVMKAMRASAASRGRTTLASWR